MPSSSNALTGLQSLSKDPLTTIEGDLGLLVRQLLTPAERKLPFAQQKQLVVQRQGEMGKIKELADLGIKGFENQKNTLQQTESTMPGAETDQFSFAKNRSFNLRRFAQGIDGGMSTPPAPMPSADPAQSQMPQFEDASDLREFLVQSGPESTSRMFTDLVSNNPEAEQTVSDALSRFFESNEPQRTLEMATVIFNMLPQSVKSSPDPNLGDTQVSAIEHTVAESNEAIRLAAIAAVQAKASAPIKKAFNLKLFKSAQHKGLENVMMFGPNQVRIDPATGYMISNWHTTERNKGWGIKMPDAMDVDFETLWRQNIMDKYSRPYRNDDGVEVGGYLNKRFETDRSVPAGNTYQLLPGQKRRAYLPEYRGYEARLQAMRSETNDRGLEFVNTDKPTDWAKEGTTFAPFNFKRNKEAKFASKKKK